MSSKKKRVAEKQTLKTKELRSKWHTIIVLPIAIKEGQDELTPGQYLHLTDQVKQLVGFGRREFESALSIRQFGDYWELREKWGTLGRKNMRVYFRFHQEKNEVVVLCTYKKEDDGTAPKHIRIRLKSRWNQYLNGNFGDNIILYKREKSNS